MARRADRVLRNVLTDAPLPQQTETYTVISHSFVINTIKQMLDAKGFSVTAEFYTAPEGAQVAYGIFHTNYGDDPDLGMLFAFANSYDKSLKFSCAVGAFVRTSNMSILSKDASAWIRKHTGTADTEAAEVIETQIENAEGYFKQLQQDKEAMKLIKLDRKQYAELLGVLTVDAKLIGIEQLGIAKKEYEKPSYTYSSDDDSLWTLYNHILVALSKSHPKTWMEQQKLVHLHMMTEYDFTVFDDEELDTPEVLGEAVDFEEDVPETLTDADIEPATEDEIAEQLYGVNNNEEEITGTEEESPFITDEEEDAVMEQILKPVEPEPEAEIQTMSMTVEEAVKKYGHMLSEEELLELDSHLNPATIDKLKSLATAYDVVTEQIDEIIKEEHAKSATDGKTQLPAIPSKTPEAEIETPEVEGVVSEVMPEFFMTRQDVLDTCPNATLEIGCVVSIGDEDYEIVTLDKDDGDDEEMVGLAELSASEETPVIKTTSEVVKEEPVNIPVENTQIGMDFEIGDAEEYPPAETMLRTGPKVIVNKVSLEDEEQAKIDAALEIMNSKIEMTPNEKAVHAVIETELKDLYGYEISFTYEIKGDQYNVTLETNEVIVLKTEYINSLKESV